jgi:hypothetical protein
VQRINTVNLYNASPAVQLKVVARPASKFRDRSGAKAVGTMVKLGVASAIQTAKLISIGVSHVLFPTRHGVLDKLLEQALSSRASDAKSTHWFFLFLLFLSFLCIPNVNIPVDTAIL